MLLQSASKNGIIEIAEFKENVIDTILDSNCLVLPSYREGASRVLLEALALTIPVIASDVPGCNNIVDHKKNGFLCKEKNHLDLYQKMKEMYEMPNRVRNIMGKNGRAKIKTQFEVKLVVDKYLAEIELLEKK